MKKEQLQASINVTQLLKDLVGASQSHDIRGMLSEEVECSVEGKARLTRIRQGVLVQCDLNAEVKLICSRCLGQFLCPISFSAEEEFRPMADVSGVSGLPATEAGEEFTIDDRNIIDLGELIRQYVLLNLPMKPLCRPDCPGMKEDKPNATTT